MDVIMTDSTTPTEFHFFPKLSAELRRMVWDEALPTLNLQRFNAEIARQPAYPHSNRLGPLTLCLTPSDDFIQVTKGYVGLLGACYESREAAMNKIEAYLTIQYITQNQDGSISIRFAKVPYNPDGQVCISGLGPALHFAAEDGLGARGTAVGNPHKDKADFIAYSINCATITEVKHLAIALDPPRQFMGQHCDMFGWDFHSFDKFARRMARHKLETMELIDDGWLDERHENKDHPVPFEWQHTRVPITRVPTGNVWPPPRVQISWSQLIDGFLANSKTLKAVKKLRAAANEQ
ncbi:hypothetical protein KVR01_010662 [Diaporthe batatas]|uniref:uncharacterized protein n=1 Tax=Diaporthe batatas TaxID=748121 RepID=UPI001D0563FF|nr:uncharacterized protein KVR01_010662 [Diaporthe batatas]KAG8160025.1 hypothetical protein KVR01_010662 [Diaporthe batatas]